MLTRIDMACSKVNGIPARSEKGEGYVQRGKIHTGVNVPARGVGIARAALKDTAVYTSSREQYGQHISEFQGVGWEVGKMAECVDTARLFTFGRPTVPTRGTTSPANLAWRRSTQRRLPWTGPPSTPPHFLSFLRIVPLSAHHTPHFRRIWFLRKPDNQYVRLVSVDHVSKVLIRRVVPWCS